jgi:polyisoprenoid-binding protein YceI
VKISTIFKILLLLLVASSESAWATPLKIDTAKSTVSAVFKQIGVAVESRFMKFGAQIDFDAASPDASKASVDIDIASFDLGDPDYNREVLKKEWFNAAQFPKASFTSTKIRGNGPGKLEVSGKLTIKGKSIDVSFPMTVKKEGAVQVFEGSLPIRRLVFNIGEGEWKDTSVVADEVVIRFRVLAKP